jgi:hypothetical protein
MVHNPTVTRKLSGVFVDFRAHFSGDFFERDKELQACRDGFAKQSKLLITLQKLNYKK